MSTSLRAPAQHGEILLHPPGSLTTLTKKNESVLSRTLSEERTAARAEVLALAQRYTSRVTGDVAAPTSSDLWIVGGHQPELFHPGVWVKNAVVAQLARRVHGVGLNLIVDNDLCSGSAVRVPVAPQSTGMTHLNWDHPQPQSPWEERRAVDHETFSTFGERCGVHLGPWGIDPLAATQDWRGRHDLPIVDRFVRLRATVERSFGLGNLEVRVSDLAETRGFRRYIGRLIGDVASLQTHYHAALHRYRKRNHIRSTSHPVPELSARDGHLEVPLWIWRAGDKHRGRLFVETISPRTYRLFSDQREVGCLSLTSPEATEQGLDTLSRNGWKIRPRAITLTLFTRLFLSSVFVHGIGGAKYDEMTDDLIRDWLHIDPPDFIVATATLRLFERFSGSSSEDEIAQMHKKLRWLRWNPERLITLVTTGLRWDQLRQEKNSLLATASGVARHESIRIINNTFQAEMRDLEGQLRSQLREQLEQRPFQTALRSREFAANLFARDEIRDLFLRTEGMISRGEMS